jgi:hypothetical protein
MLQLCYRCAGPLEPDVGVAVRERGGASLRECVEAKRATTGVLSGVQPDDTGADDGADFQRHWEHRRSTLPDHHALDHGPHAFVYTVKALPPPRGRHVSAGEWGSDPTGESRDSGFRCRPPNRRSDQVRRNRAPPFSGSGRENPAPPLVHEAQWPSGALSAGGPCRSAGRWRRAITPGHLRGDGARLRCRRGLCRAEPC